MNVTLFVVLVQKLQHNCNESLNLGHTDTITLKRVRDQYRKARFIQVETLSA
jgi:hypothetical protein